MKKTILVIAVTACITVLLTYLLTASIYSKAAPPEKKKRSKTTFFLTENPERTLDTVSIDSARYYIHNLNAAWDHLTGDTTGSPIRAFTLNLQDVYAVLGITETVPPPYTLRVYLGLAAHDSFKLFVVPADTGSCRGCGRDHFFVQNADGGFSIDPNPDKGQYVLDLNAPCPATCDQKSPLVIQQYK